MNIEKGVFGKENEKNNSEKLEEDVTKGVGEANDEMEGNLKEAEWWKSNDSIELAWGQLNDKIFKLEGGWENFLGVVRSGLEQENIYYSDLKGNPSKLREQLYSKIKLERPDLLEKIPYNEEMFLRKEQTKEDDSIEESEQSVEDHESRHSSIEVDKIDNFLRDVIGELGKAKDLHATREEMKTAIDKAMEKILSAYDMRKDEIMPENIN